MPGVFDQPRHKACAARVQCALGEERFTREVAAGRKMPLETAVQLALSPSG